MNDTELDLEILTAPRPDAAARAAIPRAFFLKPGDLEANRRGRLSAGQARVVRIGAAGAAVVFAALFAVGVWLIYSGDFSLWVVIGTPLMLFAVIRSVHAFVASYKARVRYVDGVVRFERRGLGKGAHWVTMVGERSLGELSESARRALDGYALRVYVVEQTLHIVSAEPMPQLTRAGVRQ